MAKKKPPRPHTEAWFQEMRDRNPQQAAMTQRTIELAGTDQCCSICGDTENVKDYMSDETVSARLCDDCKGIQERMHSAKFLPMV